MSGLYLACLLGSAAGLALLDARFRLVLFRRPGLGALVIAIGLAFFLLWDLVGIAAGVFLRGDGPWQLGIELAPELPVEELVFLAFLSYLTLLLYATALRWLARRSVGQAAAAQTPAGQTPAIQTPAGRTPEPGEAER